MLISCHGLSIKCLFTHVIWL